MRFQYAIVEWIWDQNSLRVNLPGGLVHQQQGSYGDVVETLSRLGLDGYEVVSCAGAGNWLLWTLKQTIG